MPISVQLLLHAGPGLSSAASQDACRGLLTGLPGNIQMQPILYEQAREIHFKASQITLLQVSQDQHQ